MLTFQRVRLPASAHFGGGGLHEQHDLVQRARECMRAAARYRAALEELERPKAKERQQAHRAKPGERIGAVNFTAPRRAYTRDIVGSAIADAESRFLRDVGAVALHSSLVQPQLVQAAEQAAIRAARELRTDVPRVHWFRTVHGGRDARGWFAHDLPGAIWISAALTATTVAAVVAHECKHRADFLAGRPVTEEAAERFAEPFVPVSDARAFTPMPHEYVAAPPFRRGDSAS